jgi:hypothetical protein
MSRTYTSAAFISLGLIMQGVAYATFDDGRRAVVRRREDLRWEHSLEGVVTAPFRTHEDAISDLEHSLANQGIMLRRGQ